MAQWISKSAMLIWQLKQLQSYDRGIKRIISHADWKPLGDFCTECDSSAYVVTGGLCYMCHQLALDAKYRAHNIWKMKKGRDWSKQKPKRPVFWWRRLFDFIDDWAIWISEALS